MTIGLVTPFAGTNAPNGWLFCEGQDVSRIEYARLFEEIGETYGAGDGSTTFTLPDMRGRLIVGTNNGTDVPNGLNASFSTRTTGDIGGAEVHTVTEAELPVHNHSITDVTTAVAGGGAPNPGGGANAISDQTTSTGNDDPHNNMMPFKVLNYIIKF